MSGRDSSNAKPVTYAQANAMVNGRNWYGQTAEDLARAREWLANGCRNSAFRQQCTCSACIPTLPGVT